MAITKVTNSLVATNAIQGTLIADNAITSVHIAQNQVTAVQIPDGSITATQLGANSVDSSELVDGSIDTSHIADAQITTAKLGTNQVTSAKIAQNSVEARHIADGSITDTQLGSGAFTMGNITTTGSIRGPASLTIDPATVGDNTGTVVIAGNLQVDGTTTTVNSTTLNVADKNITLGNGGSASANNGGGITIDGAAATMLYTHSTTSFDFNKPVNVTGAFSASGNITGTLATAAQTNITSVGTLTALIGGTGDLNWDSGTLFVDSSANRVGIGTTSPSQKLDVAGNLKLSDGYIEFDKPNVKGFRFLQNDTGNDLSIQQGDTNNANYVTKFNISSAGNVGISATPSADWSGNSVLQMSHGSFTSSSSFGAGVSTNLVGTAAGWSAKYLADGAASAYLQATSDGSHRFYTVGSGSAGASASLAERMRIDSSGDVLIGQTSQTGYAFAQKLVVGDGDNNDGITIQSGSTHQGNLAFNHSDGTTAYGRISYQHQTNYMQFFTNNAEKMRIDSAGTIKSSVNGGNANLILDNDADTPYLRFDESSAAKFTIGEGSVVGGASGDGFYDFYGAAGIGQRFFTAAGERLRIDTSGRILIGATAAAVHGNVDDLQIGNGVGNRGIGIHSANNANGAIFFSDPDSQLSGQVEYSHNGDYMIFVTGAGVRGRFDSDGLKFGGDSAAANALDDYEEGSWTPAFNMSSGSVGYDTTNSTGSYTKVGSLVCVVAAINLSSVSSPSGNLAVSGLPYNAGPGEKFVSAISISLLRNLSTNFTIVRGYVSNNGNVITLHTGATGTGHVPLNANTLQANTQFYFQLSYNTDE